MPIQSSFPAVADQVISFNKNIVDILSKINSLATTQNPSVNIQIYDENGVLRNYTVPSFTSLKGEIDRLNNNINSLYSIVAAGAMKMPVLPALVWISVGKIFRYLLIASPFLMA